MIRRPTLLRAAGMAGVLAISGTVLTGVPAHAEAGTVPPPSRRSSMIQAELPNTQSGISNEPTTDVGGGENAAYIAAGDWLRFANVTFPNEFPMNFFGARVASGARPGVTGTMEVRLDAITAPVIATVPVGTTGGWQNWRTDTVVMSRTVAGVHDVYLTFTGPGRADFVNVNWVTFS